MIESNESSLYAFLKIPPPVPNTVLALLFLITCTVHYKLHTGMYAGITHHHLVYSKSSRYQVPTILECKAVYMYVSVFRFVHN